MRIAVLADIHGNLPALEAVLSHLESTGGAEEIWVLGDLAVFCPYPEQVLERLADLRAARFLQGNTDRYLVTGRRPPQMSVMDRSQWRKIPAMLKERDVNFRWTVEQLGFERYSFLRGLPFRLRADVPGFGSVLAVHASPIGDEVGIWEDTADDEMGGILKGTNTGLLLCGHTHHQLERSLGEVLVVNPGSVGLPLDGDQRAAYATLDLGADDCRVALHRVVYDLDEVIARLEDVAHPARDGVSARLRLAANP